MPGPGGDTSQLGLIGEAWLVPTHPCFSPLTPERGLEDHESVVEVQAAWPIGGDSRFVFRKNFAKYELFKNAPVSVLLAEGGGGVGGGRLGTRTS